MNNLQVIPEGKWQRIKISGNHTWTPSTFFPQLDSVLLRIKFLLEENKDCNILFDLSDLDTIDSSLITIFVQTVRLCGKKPVCIIAPNNDVYHWLCLLGINRLAQIFETNEEWRNKQEAVPQI
jgi:anti-anti-sigma regulatory factor